MIHVHAPCSVLSQRDTQHRLSLFDSLLLCQYDRALLYRTSASLHDGSGGIARFPPYCVAQRWRNDEGGGVHQSVMAVSNYVLPPPPALEIHDHQASEKWKKFKRAWDNYLLATGLSEKTEAVQVATLLTVIGEEAREVFSTFSGWANEGDECKIGPVLGKFEQYCQPWKHVSFERYRFNRRMQESGESYDQYRTALRKIAEGCDFGTITPDEILRDRLVFGIREAKTRERLLRESNSP